MINHKYGYMAVSSSETFVYIAPDEFPELKDCKTRKELVAKIKPIIKKAYPHLIGVNFARGAHDYEVDNKSWHYQVFKDKLPNDELIA